MNNLAETSVAVAPEADQALLADLRARWPILSEPKPLKLGIRQDLRAALDGVSGMRLSRALVIHVASPEYQQALAAGGPRYALDGSPCGEVTPKDQRHAQAVLEGRAAPPQHKRMKPKRKKAAPPAKADAQPKAVAPKKTKATPAAEPPPNPTPPAAKPPTIGKSGKPVLSLKPKTGPVASITITRKEPKP